MRYLALWSLVRFKAVGMSRVVRRVGRLFACVGSLVVTAAAVVMLGASGVMLFHIAKGSEADKSRVVRTVPASFTTAVSSSIAKPAVPSVAEVGRSEQSIAEVVRSGQPAAEVIRSEQPAAEVVERREPPPTQTAKQKPKKVAAKQKRKPRFAERNPYRSWGGGPYYHW